MKVVLVAVLVAMPIAFAVAKGKKDRFPASVVTEEFAGTFTSPPRDPASILIDGSKAVIYMKSRWLEGMGSHGGDLTEATMTVKFKCESESRCTMTFPKN